MENDVSPEKKIVLVQVKSIAKLKLLVRTWNKGASMPASTRLVLRFFMLLERLRVHWHAAARTPTEGCDMAVTIYGRTFASMTCFLQSSFI